MLVCLRDSIAAVTPTALCQSFHAIIYYLTCKLYSGFLRLCSVGAFTSYQWYSTFGCHCLSLMGPCFVTVDPCLTSFCWDRWYSCHSCAPGFIPQVGMCCFTEITQGIKNKSGSGSTCSGGSSRQGSLSLVWAQSLGSWMGTCLRGRGLCLCLVRQVINCCGW